MSGAAYVRREDVLVSPLQNRLATTAHGDCLLLQKQSHLFHWCPWQMLAPTDSFNHITLFFAARCRLIYGHSLSTNGTPTFQPHIHNILCRSISC